MPVFTAAASSMLGPPAACRVVPAVSGVGEALPVTGADGSAEPAFSPGSET